MSRENLHRRGDSKSRATMREKLVEKQKATDEHESNFTAGRVNVRERYLHRTGIRGRKSWIFFCILYILLIIIIVNLIMLVILYNVLQIDKDGMKCLSFFKTGKLRWTCLSDLDAVTLYKNQIGSFKDQDIMIETDKEKVIFHGGPTTASAQMYVGPEQTEIRARNGFRFVEPYEKKTILNLNGSTWFVQQEYVSASQVAAEALVTHRVVSNENQNLSLKSENKAEISGNEGIYVDGKTVTLSSNSEMKVSSTAAQRIDISGESGVFISDRIPETPTGPNLSSLERFKLCACASTGKLFRVVVNSTASSCNTVQKMC